MKCDPALSRNSQAILIAQPGFLNKLYLLILLINMSPMNGDSFFSALCRIVGEDNASRYAKRFGPLDDMFINGLRNYEGLAFYAYSTELNWHDRINRDLWSGSPGSDVLTFKSVLNNALSKLPPYLLNQRIAYRGYLTEDFEVFCRRYQPEGTVHFPGFTSASFREDGAFGGNVLFIIRTLTAKAIWHLAANYDEFEVLVPAGRSFTVLHVEKRSNKAVINLEEQP